MKWLGWGITEALVFPSLTILFKIPENDLSLNNFIGMAVIKSALLTHTLNGIKFGVSKSDSGGVG